MTDHKGDNLSSVDLAAQLAEAEEKLAFLAAGCLNLTRDQLIERITAVGPARFKAGVWLAEREDAAVAAAFRDAADDMDRTGDPSDRLAVGNVSRELRELADGRSV